MTNPFEVLGISSNATAEEVRHAYHLLAKKYHPDQFQDPVKQKNAQQQMVMLNRAYQEALKLATSRAASPYTQQIDCDDAVQLAEKMLRQRNPQGALRQLLRSSSKNATWFYEQGKILMALEQYDSAHQSFREAVRREPENILYRRGAFDAAIALKESQSLGGKVKHVLKETRSLMGKVGEALKGLGKSNKTFRH